MCWYSLIHLTFHNNRIRSKKNIPYYLKKKKSYLRKFITANPQDKNWWDPCILQIIQPMVACFNTNSFYKNHAFWRSTIIPVCWKSIIIGEVYILLDTSSTFYPAQISTLVTSVQDLESSVFPHFLQGGVLVV